MLTLTIELACRALKANGLHAGLTLVGLTIGVGALVTATALGAGARSSIAAQISAAGANVLVVRSGNYRARIEDVGGGVVDHQAALAPPSTPRSRRTARVRSALGTTWPGVRVWTAAMHPEDDPMEKHNHPTAKQRLGDLAAGLGDAATLTADDAEAIRLLPGVQYVAAGVHETVRVAADQRMWLTRLHGTDAELFRIRRAWTQAEGRFLTATDVADSRQVAVLGSIVAARLFGYNNPIGREIRVWNQPFEVVGVVGSLSWAARPAEGDDQFDAVYVPFSTVQRLLNLSRLNTVTVATVSVGAVSQVATRIAEVLRARHGIGDAAPDDFVVHTPARDTLGRGLAPQLARVITGNVAEMERVTLEGLSGTLDRAGRTMTLLLAAVAIVSLLVSGIGIANMMLLSVAARTREIGLRLAVGARASHVLWQFLAEALLLSGAGALAGLVLGVLVTVGVEHSLEWSVALPAWALLFGFCAGAVVGAVFGFVPARRAARLDPIEALRGS